MKNTILLYYNEEKSKYPIFDFDTVCNSIRTELTKNKFFIGKIRLSTHPPKDEWNKNMIDGNCDANYIDFLIENVDFWNIFYILEKNFNFEFYIKWYQRDISDIYNDKTMYVQITPFIIRNDNNKHYEWHKKEFEELTKNIEKYEKKKKNDK